MDTEPALLRKSYSAPFVLDRGKLSRMLTILEKRRGDQSPPPNLSCEVRLKNGKRLVLRSSTELFGLDNTVKNPIVELDIRQPLIDDTGRHIDFHLHFDTERYSNIRLTVVSSDVRLVNEVFAELEEQIDRALVSSWITRYMKSRRFEIFAPVVLMLPALLLSSVLLPSKGRNLSDEAVSAQINALAVARTDSAKLDALVATRIVELRSQLPTSWQADLQVLLSWRTAFIAVPTIILGMTIVYMIVVCYPWAVFAWGDYEQHYTDLVSRRRTLGTVVVASLILGVLGNLFAASITITR